MQRLTAKAQRRRGKDAAVDRQGAKGAKIRIGKKVNGLD
jgi:hypothetical protein